MILINAMKPELLSPAGSYEAALAAFQYGADAIYLGLSQFSARAEAQNISLEELALISAYAKTFNPPKKIYITFNTLLHNSELEEAFKRLSLLEELQPDGVIVQDLGVARMIRTRFPSLHLHASTQMAAQNVQSVLALKELGFERVVLARELSLQEIGNITRNCDIEIEIFVHGALCYSYSGLCLFSSLTTGRSGNRGRCAYCCRHPFKCNGEQKHPFSMKDMSLLPLLDEVTATGVHSLKIEGRMKSPLYVACVTNAYRRKIDGQLSIEDERRVTGEIQTIFSRPWTTLYTESVRQEAENIIDALTVGHRGTQIGKVAGVRRDKKRNTYISFQTARLLEKFDGIQIDIPGMARPYGFSVRNMFKEGEKRNSLSVPAGCRVEIEIADSNVPEINKGAVVYCSSSQDVQNKYRIEKLRASDFNTGIPLNIEVTLGKDGISLKAASPTSGDRAENFQPAELEAARSPLQSFESIRKACSRLGDTKWALNSFSLNDPQGLYAPPAIVNQARRELTEKLDSTRDKRLSRIADEYMLELNSGTSATAEPLKPEFTLKNHIAAPLPAQDELEKYSRVVIEIDLREPENLLNRIREMQKHLNAGQTLLLATPLITRAPDMDALHENIQVLSEKGFKNWECAELSGYMTLKLSGIFPVSADWTLYAFNSEASAMLHEMGFESHVTSPELELEDLYPYGSYCEKELLVYQHTPLYISATPPLTGSDEDFQMIKDSSGELAVYHRGKEWITTSVKATDRRNGIEAALKTGISRFRIDYSWSNFHLKNKEN